MSRRYANARLHPRRSLTWFTQITLIPPGALSYFTENRHPTFLHWRSAVTLSRRFVAGSELLERRISVAISRVRSKFQKFAIPLASGGIAVSCVNFSAPPATRDRLARFSRNNASSLSLSLSLSLSSTAACATSRCFFSQERLCGKRSRFDGRPNLQTMTQTDSRMQTR